MLDSILGSLLVLLAVAAWLWQFGQALRRLWTTAEVRNLLLTTAATLFAIAEARRAE